jgi:hypothetical protein
MTPRNPRIVIRRIGAASVSISVYFDTETVQAASPHVFSDILQVFAPDS